MQMLEPALWRPVYEPIIRPRVRSLTANWGTSLEGAIRGVVAPDVWYDPSDLSSLFQDSAGTTPVTALEQPVGLMMDKSRGLVPGSELVVNGDFSNGTTGWTGAGDSFSISGGVATLARTTTFTYYQGVAFNVTAGRAYWVTGTWLRSSGTGHATVQIRDNAGGAVRFQQDASPGTAFQTFQFLWTPTATESVYVRVGVVNAAATVQFDLVSVRELPGYHATNIPGDTTTRPVTKAGVLLNFDGANDGMVSSTGGGATSGFAFITAIKLQGGSKTQTVFSDAGTNAGFRVRINSSNQLELSAGNGSTFVSAATTDTLSVGTTAVIAAWHDGVNLNVQVNNGTVAQQSLAAATAGTAGFTLGRDNGAASSFMQAQTSAMLYAKKVLTASQIAVAKRYCAQKSGVAL